MATEYRLTLSGETSKEDVAARAVADVSERPTPTASGQVLTTNLYQSRGLELDVTSGRGTYLEADSDTGNWHWEPGVCVSVTVRLDDERWEEGQRNMLEIVSSLLASGSEDAALILDGNFLLLTRFASVIVKHRRSMWWDQYRYANEIVPD
jgi:hypothetical protein